MATEGPLGWTAVTAANKLRIPVSSDFHTNFDHYSGHYGIAQGWSALKIDHSLDSPGEWTEHSTPSHDFSPFATKL